MNVKWEKNVILLMVNLNWDPLMMYVIKFYLNFIYSLSHPNYLSMLQDRFSKWNKASEWVAGVVDLPNSIDLKCMDIIKAAKWWEVVIVTLKQQSASFLNKVSIKYFK